MTWDDLGRRAQTEHGLVRPIARYQDRSDYARLSARVQELTHAGWSVDAIASRLDGDGYPPLRPLRGSRGWSRASVQTLRRQLSLGTTRQRGQSRAPLGPHEWWARELAQRLAIAHNSLIDWIEHGLIEHGLIEHGLIEHGLIEHGLIEHGLVRARKEHGGWQRWIVWADAAEPERLRAYRDRDIADDYRRRWTAAYTGTNHSKGSTP